jgi:hypothetical protein
MEQKIGRYSRRVPNATFGQSGLFINCLVDPFFVRFDLHENRSVAVWVDLFSVSAFSEAIPSPSRASISDARHELRVETILCDANNLSSDFPMFAFQPRFPRSPREDRKISQCSHKIQWQRFWSTADHIPNALVRRFGTDDNRDQSDAIWKQLVDTDTDRGSLVFF